LAKFKNLPNRDLSPTAGALVFAAACFAAPRQPTVWQGKKVRRAAHVWAAANHSPINGDFVEGLMSHLHWSLKLWQLCHDCKSGQQ
jgi:hypothetical protein